jgi:hypothetical protein
MSDPTVIQPQNLNAVFGLLGTDYDGVLNLRPL